MVAYGDRRHALADRFDDATALMAQDSRKNAFRILSRQRVGIGMADTGRNNPHQYLAGLRRLDVDLNDLQRLIGSESDGGAGFDGHGMGSGKQGIGQK
jgi:hypothetical protein